MRPHPEDLHRSLFWQDLIDQSVLHIDSSRVSSREVAHEFLESRRLLPWVRSKDSEKLFGLFAHTAVSHLPGVFLRLLGEDDQPGPRLLYQPGRFEVFESGVRISF